MTAPWAGRKEWTALAVLLLPLLLVSMDVSVLYFAVPFISRDLEPTATQQLWIFDIYGFVLAGLLLTMGALGDRIGRRRLLLIGATAFGAASIAAASAHSAEMLITVRALLGIGGATLMPSTLALVRNMFRDQKQRWLILVSAGIVAVGIVTVMTLITDLALGTVPPEKSGSAAALLETGQEFGAALGTAVLGSIGTAVYRRDVTDAAPAGLPPGALRSVRETLGSALVVSDRLPGRAGAALASAARDAFTSGMHAAAIGAMAVMLLASGFAIRRLRGLAPAAAPADAARPHVAPDAEPTPV